MFISILHQHYKMQRRSACEERTVMIILMALTILCLLNSLVLLGQHQQLHDHSGAFSIGRYHVEEEESAWKPPVNKNAVDHHRLPHTPFKPDKQHSLFRKKKMVTRTTKQDIPKQDAAKANNVVDHDDDKTKPDNAQLRRQWESTHTYRTAPAERVHYPIVTTLPYDVYHCNKTHPPVDYPIFFAAATVLSHWNVNELPVPTDYHYDSLCVFDWTKDYDAIQVYQRHEVPFVVIHHPEVDKTVQRWQSDDYLTALIDRSGMPQRTEYSLTNHLMYWKSHGRHHDPPDFVPPTEDVPMTFAEWKVHADRIANMTNAKDEPHWYLRYNAAKPNLHSELYAELPFFDPDVAAPAATTTGDFLVDQRQERGINCRFGMAGGIAEAHFDPTRNWILHLGGTGPRRYILAHPSQCANFMLYPQNHPSGRHASIDWSTEYTTEPFASARVLETVLQASDALYLPTSWLHFIVALGTNYQCNARSGTTTEHRQVIQECGFFVPL
jgi:hypothetical protein